LKDIYQRTQERVAARALRRIEKVMELKVRDWYLEK
jgi:hypothetical protein